jgi:hypothetical protein
LRVVTAGLACCAVPVWNWAVSMPAAAKQGGQGAHMMGHAARVHGGQCQRCLCNLRLALRRQPQGMEAVATIRITP